MVLLQIPQTIKGLSSLRVSAHYERDLFSILDALPENPHEGLESLMPVVDV